MVNELMIAGRTIGAGSPCFLIAEAGVNHNGDPHLARRLIDAAADACADAVKFQTFKAELVMMADAPKAEYQQRTTGAEESQIEMVRKFELPFDVFAELQSYAAGRGILFLSTPFDYESADYLDGLGVPAHKIPSGEITNHPFLAHIAAKGKPIILSTGMSTLTEVQDAVNVIRGAGDPPLALLHCVSSYPADPATTNLRAMETLARAFGVPVGYSDHTLGLEIPLAAVALGACIIEKHFTLDRTLPGPDHQASMEPADLTALVRGVRRIESALGDGRKRPADQELDVRMVARRSLVLKCGVAAGETIEASMLLELRPGTGISPAEIHRVVGRRAARPLTKGSLLRWEDMQ